jgi:hypothetical protein
MNVEMEGKHTVSDCRGEAGSKAARSQDGDLQRGAVRASSEKACSVSTS